MSLSDAKEIDGVADVGTEMGSHVLMIADESRSRK
jgi:hypothetical protein